MLPIANDASLSMTSSPSSPVINLAHLNWHTWEPHGYKQLQELGVTPHTISQPVPSWLHNAKNAQLRARIVDYHNPHEQPNSNMTRYGLQSYLQWLGFIVKMDDGRFDGSVSQQIGSECGLIAAAVHNYLAYAPEWYDVPAQDLMQHALQRQTLRDMNERCSEWISTGDAFSQKATDTFTRKLLAPAEETVPAKEARLEQTRFLDDKEISSLLKLLMPQPDPSLQAVTSTEPGLLENHSVLVTSLDVSVMKMVEGLHSALTSGADAVQRFIVNTLPFPHPGFHWFSVIFEVKFNTS